MRAGPTTSGGRVTSLTPCAVVVDSRNLVGQAARLFGIPSNFTLNGLRQALAGFRPRANRGPGWDGHTRVAGQVFEPCNPYV